MQLNKVGFLRLTFLVTLLVSCLGATKSKPTVFSVSLTPTEFARSMYQHALPAAKALGVDPKLLVAQAAHETNWGKKIPRNRDGSSSYNLFGIKSSPNYRGKVVHVHTKEYRGGKLKVEKAGFRAYDSFDESFSDYAAMLKRLSRYQTALTKKTQAYEFLVALQKSGYATDPLYAKKIYSIYQSKIIKQLI